jgi:hypothetical protein
MKKKDANSDQHPATSNGITHINHITPPSSKDPSLNTEISNPPIPNSADNAADGEVF